MDEEYEYENVLEELECPTCKVYMSPPIRMCERGHSICEPCMLKLPKCPLCQENFIAARNISLQSLSDKTRYSYPNQSLSCSVKRKLPQKEQQHEKNYSFNDYKCATEACIWTGALKDITNHWMLCNSSELRSSISNFYMKMMTGDTYLINMAKAFNQLFWIKCKLESGRIYWTVQLLGPEEEANNYCYEIDIYKLENYERRITFRDYCKPVEIDNNVLFSTDVCLTSVNIKCLKNLLDKNLYMHYTVRIYTPF